jgi:hypothetical protein
LTIDGGEWSSFGAEERATAGTQDRRLGGPQKQYGYGGERKKKSLLGITTLDV